ncbi:hypothetical protein HUZ36_19015 [Pseudoalteromonas sp. McH1-7]|uniref:hypothetical protein n=1 Tax=Pseudoalteromonas sp. McH1-7 TaxID=2745574 RepID=UPI001590E35D|nr:hypothetical protein [Pseudoalteromonas sp. McH1-7]NUZ12874.1 hypothetical protein [Pseudoalteromonas sp. McH1-7]
MLVNQQLIFALSAALRKVGLALKNYILFNALLLLWFAAFFNHHISAGNVTWSPMMQKLAFLVLGSIVSFIFTFYKVSKKQKGHWKLYNSFSFVVMVLSIALSASQVWGL